MRSVTSPQFGRLLHLRVVGQNNVLVGFPATVVAQTDLELVITYGGRLPPQSVDREAVTVPQERVDDAIQVPIEPQFTYSNRSYWYPQTPVTDYATAKLTINVPGDLDVVASGAQRRAAGAASRAARAAPAQARSFSRRRSRRAISRC